MLAAFPMLLSALLASYCPKGCIIGPDLDLYRITTLDKLQLGRAVECETGQDSHAAIAWSMLQNWTRRRLTGRHEPLGSFVAAYSSCSSPRWAKSNHPRIGPRARLYSRLEWHQLSKRTRMFVTGFLQGLHPNRWPGWCYFLAASFAERAPVEWGRPSYTRPRNGRARNAYWTDPSTIGWTTRTVILFPTWQENTP